MRLSEKINGSLSSRFIQSLNESCSEKLEETSSKELEAREDDLRQREVEALRDAGDENPENLVGVYQRLPEELAKEFQAEEAELNAINMIHSILTYTGKHNWTEEYVLDNEYMQDYKNTLGEDKLKEIVANEVEYFKNHATILNNVYTDGEGVSYNSVEFKEAEEIYGNELNEDSEVITFREILDRMENATEYAELHDAATLIKDTELRDAVEQLITDCAESEDSVETAYSIVSTDLLDTMIDELNEEKTVTE